MHSLESKLSGVRRPYSRENDCSRSPRALELAGMKARFEVERAKLYCTAIKSDAKWKDRQLIQTMDEQGQQQESDDRQRSIATKLLHSQPNRFSRNTSASRTVSLIEKGEPQRMKIAENSTLNSFQNGPGKPPEGYKVHMQQKPKFSKDGVKSGLAQQRSPMNAARQRAVELLASKAVQGGIKRRTVTVSRLRTEVMTPTTRNNGPEAAQLANSVIKSHLTNDPSSSPSQRSPVKISRVSVYGDACIQPVTSLKRLTTGKAMEMLKIGIKREIQAADAEQSPLKLKDQVTQKVTQMTMPEVDIVVTSYNVDNSHSGASPTLSCKKRLQPKKLEAGRIDTPQEQIFQQKNIVLHEYRERMETAQNLALTAIRFKVDPTSKVKKGNKSPIKKFTQNEIGSHGTHNSNNNFEEATHILSFNMGSTLAQNACREGASHHETEDLDSRHFDAKNSISQTEESVQRLSPPLSPQMKIKEKQSSVQNIMTKSLPRRSPVDTPVDYSINSTSSLKKQVLSLYAGQFHVNKDSRAFESQNKSPSSSPKDRSKTETKKMPLSVKYANLITQARQQIEKDAFDFVVSTKKASGYRPRYHPDQKSLKERYTIAQQMNFESMGAHRQRLMTEQDSQSSSILQNHEKIDEMYQVSSPGAKVLDHGHATQDLLKTDGVTDREQVAQKSMLTKLKKMEMARKMLQMQTMWNHNMKHARQSQQKQRQTKGVFASMLSRQAALKDAMATPQGNTTGDSQSSAYQIDDVWQSYKKIKDSVRKPFRQPYHRNYMFEKSSTTIKNNDKTLLPHIPSTIAVEQSAIGTERVGKVNRFSKVPLLSDPVASPRAAEESLITHSQLFRGKKRQISDADKQHRSVLDFIGEGKAQKSVLGKNSRSQAHHHSRSQIGKLVGTSASARASIENIISPRLPRSCRHAPSLSHSVPHHPLLSEVSNLPLLNVRQQRIIKPNFREQQARLRDLIKKRNALKQRQHDVAADREAGKSTLKEVGTITDAQIQEGIDSPCSDERCGYCSSHGDSIFGEEEKKGLDPDLGSVSQAIQALNKSLQKQDVPVNQQTNYSQKYQWTEGIDGFDLEEGPRNSAQGTDLLRIQTQVLSPRPKIDKSAARGYYPETEHDFDDEVERHSIAVDMRAMQEMHKSFESKNRAQHDASKRSQQISPSREYARSPSPYKRQTHTTLYNQHNLPEYMVQSQYKRIGGKRNSSANQHRTSQFLRLDQPNLDLAHIEKNVSKFSPPLKSVRQLAKHKDKTVAKSKDVEQSNGASSNGFDQSLNQMRQGYQQKLEKHKKGFLKQAHDCGSSLRDSQRNNVLIDREALLKITFEKAERAKAQARDFNSREKTRLEPSRSGFFGPGSAAGSNMTSSNQSLLKSNPELLLNKPRIYSDNKASRSNSRDESPLEKLIKKAGLAAELALNPKAGFQRVIQDSPQQTSICNEGEDQRLVSMFKSAPRSQIGLKQKQQQTKAGVGGSTLLRKKGVSVGGGGKIGTRLPQASRYVSFQALVEKASSSDHTSTVVPGNRFVNSSRKGKQSPNGSVLDLNAQIYKKTQNKSNNQLTPRRDRQPQNTDLEVYLQETEGSRQKAEAVKTPSRHRQAKRGSLVEKKTFIQQAMRVTGQGVQSMHSLANGKLASANDLSDLMRRTTLMNATKKKQKSVDSNLSNKIASVHVVNALFQDRGDANRENETSAKKDSLFITLTGKGSISELVPSEHFVKPSVDAIRITNPAKKKMASVHATSSLISVAEDGDILSMSCEDAQVGLNKGPNSSLTPPSSHLSANDQESSELAKLASLIETQRLLQYPSDELSLPQEIDNRHLMSIEDQNEVKLRLQKQYTFGTIELGEGDANKIMMRLNSEQRAKIPLKPDFTVKGMSMAELQGLFRQSKPFQAKQYHKSSPGLQRMLQNRSQERLSKADQKFSDLLKINTYHRSTLQQAADSESTINGVPKQDRVGSSNGSLAHKQIINIQLTMPAPFAAYRKVLTKKLNDASMESESASNEQPKVDLYDLDEVIRQHNIKQEVTEQQKGKFKHIEQTSKMRMFNSTIMKIVVTQKKPNALPASSEEFSCECSPSLSLVMGSRSPRMGALQDSRFDASSPKSGSGGIFGSSVLINGVAMQPSRLTSPKDSNKCGARPKKPNNLSQPRSKLGVKFTSKSYNPKILTSKQSRNLPIHRRQDP